MGDRAQEVVRTHSSGPFHKRTGYISRRGAGYRLRLVLRWSWGPKISDEPTWLCYPRLLFPLQMLFHEGVRDVVCARPRQSPKSISLSKVGKDRPRGWEAPNEFFLISNIGYAVSWSYAIKVSSYDHYYPNWPGTFRLFNGSIPKWELSLHWIEAKRDLITASIWSPMSTRGPCGPFI